MANNCNTGVYDLCDKLSEAHLIFKNMSEDERLIVNFLESQDLVFKFSEEDFLVCGLSWLGEDFVSLWSRSD